MSAVVGPAGRRDREGEQADRCRDGPEESVHSHAPSRVNGIAGTALRCSRARRPGYRWWSRPRAKAITSFHSMSVLLRLCALAPFALSSLLSRCNRLRSERDVRGGVWSAVQSVGRGRRAAPRLSKRRTGAHGSRRGCEESGNSGEGEAHQRRGRRRGWPGRPAPLVALPRYAYGTEARTPGDPGSASPISYRSGSPCSPRRSGVPPLPERCPRAPEPRVTAHALHDPRIAGALAIGQYGAAAVIVFFMRFADFQEASRRTARGRPSAPS